MSTDLSTSTINIDPSPESASDGKDELQPREDEALGPYLRRVRISRGLNLPGVARALIRLPKEMRISHPYLSQVELGQVAQPSRDRLVSLANLYQIPSEWLLRKAGYTLTLDEPTSSTSGIVQQILLRVEQLSPADQNLFLTMLDAVVKQRRDEKHNGS